MKIDRKEVEISLCELQGCPVTLPQEMVLDALYTADIVVPKNELVTLLMAILDASTMFPTPLLDAAALRMKKHADYQGGDTELKDYFPFGLASYAQMVHIKSTRLVSLVQSNKEPDNESIRDTMLDLINYCCFALEDDEL